MHRERGQVRYEALPCARKAELAQYLRDSLGRPDASTTWQQDMQATVRQVMARRAASGASLDAADITEEVLPLVRLAIPDRTRTELFRQIISSIDGKCAE